MDMRTGCWLKWNTSSELFCQIFPTNIASVNLVMGCSITRAGVRIVG